MGDAEKIQSILRHYKHDVTLAGLVAGRDELQNMEGLGDLSSDPDAAPGFPVSLGLSEALEVAGLSEQGDAKPFEKAFGEWCRQWHLYDGWQHVAALQTLVSMTQGWGAKDGDHKYESLTTLDLWTPPTEGLTAVHRQLKLPPFGWIPTEQAWPAFESEVLARVKAELAQFKEEAEAHFKASRLERKKSKRTDPRMRELLLFQMEGKPEEVAEVHFGGKDELKRIESKTTHLPMRILIRFQIEGKKRREIIDEFWEDELGRLGEEGRYVRLESLEREVSRYVHDTAKRIGIQVRTKQRTPPSSHATEGS